MIVDYLLDTKGEVEVWRGKAEKAKRRDSREEAREMAAYAYNQGLQALRRWERQVPRCVKDYYLGDRKDRPGYEEILAGKRDLPEKCPRCSNGIREIPAGISKRTGQAYRRFWVCENPECDFTYNDRHDANRNGRKNSRVIGKWLVYLVVIVLTLLAIFL